jgi:ATP-binding cassette subfamily F protein uup
VTSFAGLEQWESWHQNRGNSSQSGQRGKQDSSKKNESQKETGSQSIKKKKLGFKEQREFDTMESTIHQAEARLADLTQESQLPENVRNSIRLVQITEEMTKLQAEIDRLYARWAELDS